MSTPTSRRQFLQAGAAAGIGFWVAGSSSAEDKKERSSVERLNFACIGVVGKGDSDCNHVCTQMGNQGTALDQFRTSVELSQSGALGNIKEAHVWTNRPV